MEAYDRSLEAFLKLQYTRFIIPIYQRKYDWKQENCLQLFEDIKSVEINNKTNHFMGSIVYISNKDTNPVASAKRLNEYLIIDGQQRLTTTMIFLKALHDLAEDESTKSKIMNILLVNQSADEKSKLRLKLIKNDDEVFKKILNNDFANIEKNSNLYINYSFFRTKIQEYNNFESLYKCFTKIVIVDICLSRKDDDPQLIFESINYTGLSLSKPDLIKNYLLMDKPPKVQLHLFEQYWVPIEKNLDSENLLNENLLNENISKFVRDFLTMKQKKIPNKASIYKDFKSFAPSKTVDAENLLKELLHYSNIYKTFLLPRDEPYEPYLKNFKQLQIGVVYPFLLPVIDSFNKDKISQSDLIKTLALLESYFIRRMVCNKGTNALNKVFAKLYNDVVPNPSSFNFDKFYQCLATVLMDKTGSAIFPKDKDFQDGFTTRNSPSTTKNTFLLWCLENKDTKEKVEISKNITLEHIMPQDLSPAWKVKLGDKYKEIRDKYLHNIGNLSLTGYNSELSNNSFDDKKRILIEKNSRLNLTQYFTNSLLVEWNGDEIEKRAKHLFNDAKNLWPCPQDIILNNPSSTDEYKKQYNLTDKISVAGKKPTSFEFFGDPHDVKSWKELFEKVVKLLLNLDEKKANLIVHDSDFVGRNRKIFSENKDNENGKQIKINDSLFLETHLSSTKIIYYVKLICEKFGLNGDDLIYIVK